MTSTLEFDLKDLESALRVALEDNTVSDLQTEPWKRILGWIQTVGHSPYPAAITAQVRLSPSPSAGGPTASPAAPAG